ncbi:MAG: hypothetical protein AAFQ66_02995 [Pseudomonadota bacterium]
MNRIRTDESVLHCPDTQRWSGVLARISPSAGQNIDTAVGAFDTIANVIPGQVIYPVTNIDPVLPQEDSQRPAIGVRVDHVSEAETPAYAAKLAALAVEKDCEVVILSENCRSGFERFGFRTERLAGKDDVEKAHCLDQIRLFWNLDLIL